MNSCSLVCHSFQEAAVVATNNIQLHSIDCQQQAEALCAWLLKHGSKAHLDLEGVWNYEFPTAAFDLPWQQLVQLQSLRVQYLELQLVCNDSTRQIASLSALTQLTSLHLGTFSASSACIRVGWIASNISSLTGLRQLKLSFVGFQPQQPGSIPNAALAAALGELVQLTSLTLESCVNGTALSTATTLSQLTRLQLLGIGGSEEALQMDDPPSSLTHLQLLNCYIQGPEDSSSWQLPSLQELEVWGVTGFRPATLAGMQQLCWLQMNNDNCTIDVEHLPEYLSQQQRLEHLELYDMQQGAQEVSDASFAGLTASSFLTSLRLTDCCMSNDAASHMFPEGRQLQQLEVGASHDLFNDYAEPPQPANFGVDQEVQRRSLTLSWNDLQQLTSCCPNLQQLSLVWSEEYGPAGNDLRQLLRLMQLTKLSVGGLDWDDGAAERVLVQLTGARGMCISMSLLHFMFISMSLLHFMCISMSLLHFMFISMSLLHFMCISMSLLHFMCISMSLLHFMCISMSLCTLCVSACHYCTLSHRWF
jgi:hypothetical protein